MTHARIDDDIYKRLMDDKDSQCKSVSDVVRRMFKIIDCEHDNDDDQCSWKETYKQNKAIMV